jgi:hypothetical protein
MPKTVFDRLEKELSKKKPVAGGHKEGTVAASAELPPKGKIKRYILTSAQNNTYVNKPLWENLLELSKYYKAEILVGTFSYNKSAWRPHPAKRGTDCFLGKDGMWYDPAVTPFICDERRELANGLVWCGEVNILPTAADPLSGFETYSHRKSAIFPHAKLAMRSIATMKGEAAKLNYTTGAVTLMNYIKKTVGFKAEHHHEYAFLVVEVNHDGNWWVRQISAAKKGRLIQDLDVLVEDGVLTTGAAVEAITFGDIHSTVADPSVVKTSHNMLDVLKPRYEFFHDVFEGVTTNHHSAKDPHVRFQNHLRGLNSLEAEVKATIELLRCYLRAGTNAVVVDSNHDSSWIMRWLRENDYRNDPVNAVLFLETQLEVYRALSRNDRHFHVLEWLFNKYEARGLFRFLRQDESFTICEKRIECGMHGDLGPNGSRGTPRNLNRIGRRANTGHTHSAGIFNGLYVGGTTSRLDWQYAKGPSSWTHSHIITYPSGQRTIITLYAGKWRA